MKRGNWAIIGQEPVDIICESELEGDNEEQNEDKACGFDESETDDIELENMVDVMFEDSDEDED